VCTKKAVVKEYFEDDFKRVDSQKTLFRLEHKDPTLKFLALADLFHSLYLEESDGSPKNSDGCIGCSKVLPTSVGANFSHGL
jgi:hypothetical protein